METEYFLSKMHGFKIGRQSEVEIKMYLLLFIDKCSAIITRILKIALAIYVSCRNRTETYLREDWKLNFVNFV